MTVAAAAALEVVPDALLHFIADGLPNNSRVFLRRGLKGKPGKFELMIAEWCRQYGHVEVRWEIPDFEEGAGAVFNRDNAMVRGSDLVLAFFAPGRMMQGGTGHVVEAAIDQGVPVYSFELNGGLVRVGENDPDAAWQPTIDSWFSAE